MLFVIPEVSSAQEFFISMSTDGSISNRSIQLIMLVTVLSLAPSLLIMVTCFPFLVTVLAILRQAIGLQQSPPNMLIVSLALFLTYYVMEPVFSQAWQLGIKPLTMQLIDVETAFHHTMEPFRVFMANRTDPATFSIMAELRSGEISTTSALESKLSVLIPSFILSEISRAFQIGFLIFLPFLIIDLVVAAILMSMGMMMVPPAIVSLPFKLAFFVVADGWSLIASALIRSYM